MICKINNLKEKLIKVIVVIICTKFKNQTMPKNLKKFQVIILIKQILIKKITHISL